MSDLSFSEASFSFCQNVFSDTWYIQGFFESRSFTANEIYHLMKKNVITKQLCVQHGLAQKWHSIVSDGFLMSELHVIHILAKNQKKGRRCECCFSFKRKSPSKSC